MTQHPTELTGIRSIHLHELDSFVELLTTHPEHAAGLRQHLLTLFARGDSQPEWCVVAEQDGHFIAGIACRMILALTPSVRIVELRLPSTVPLEVSAHLLRFVLGLTAQHGAQQFIRTLEPDGKDSEVQVNVFERLGFPLVRETVRYVWPGGTPTSPPARLTFQPVSEVGMQVLIGAMALSLDGSLDQVMQRKAGEHGDPQRWAESEYRSWMADYQVQPEWWELAYDEHGGLVGFILPGRLGPAEGTVVYLAVLPEFRGAGYGLELLRRGTQTLLRAGLSTILLDTDVLNAPTQRLNEQAGYHRQGTVRRYQGDVWSLLAPNLHNS
ncbi:GNAT family N-acetyltransferase [Deinococcus sonorensis]|uniref:GNAT family N-acetyltransferase n=2 Tax=Deinococcus sonorensis TaxID=309891 RepID=A0AAU7U692_9DEIO